MNLHAPRDSRLEVVKHIYAGQQKIWKVYRGSTKIWQLNKVNFKDWDGTLLKTEEVVSGNPASAPADPARSGYDFTGWSPASFSSIESDTDITAQYAASSSPAEPTITEVNAVLVTDAKDQTLDYQNRSFGYMHWTGEDLPVWKTKPSLVFDNESYLSQNLNNASVTATGYNGVTMTVSNSGRSGITLKSIVPKTTVLYTKVKISPYIAAYVICDGTGIGYNSKSWYYDDRLDVTNDYSVYLTSSLWAVTGRSYYSRGKYFQVVMTVVDSNGTYRIPSAVQMISDSTNGWKSGTPTPTTLTFDFTATLAAAGVRKDAHTTKVEFLEGITSSPAWPMALNACCLYKDTLNG